MNEVTVRDWIPTARTILLLNIGGIAVLVAGLIIYVGIWSATSGSTSASFTAIDVLVTVLFTFGLMVLHEGVHGLTIAAFGGRARYGATMIGKTLPAFYCTAPGTRFTRRQFIVIALMPAFVLGLGTALAIATLPSGGWLVVPAAVHLGGCVGDFAMTFVAARTAPGTLIEDGKSGMRLFIPKHAAMDALP